MVTGTLTDRTILSIRGLCKSFDGTDAVDRIDLDVGDGEFLTLLGPSGCGKTTLLRLIAGFETPDSGTILLNGADICPLPPEKRPVNTVFQSYALFPHLCVFDNVAFGLTCRKTPRSEITARVTEALEQTQLSAFAERKPAQLSGGQQQRVALARAIVNKPQLLLLDEPLSALDARLRSEMQIELKRLQRELGITTILVTHEQDEALSLSDRVAVMSRGAIAQIGSPREIYEEPRSLYVARFIGEINLLPALVRGRGDGNRVLLSILGQDMTLESKLAIEAGARAHVLLRPEDLRLSGDIQEGMVRFAGEIRERRYHGATLETRIRLDDGQTVTACEFFDEDDPDFDYRIGERVEVSWVRGWEVLLADEPEG